MNLANEFFLFRAADGLPVTSNWVEAYLNLCDRALRQKRNRLSLEIARHLVLDQGRPNHARGAGHFQEAYQQLLEKEARTRFDGILRTGLNLLNDATDFRQLLGEVNVPTNILRLVSAWGTPVQKGEIAALFVAYVEAVANKAPLDRMSAFLSSGFWLVGSSGSAELRRRFLAAILLWLLEHRALPESEQAKFAFYVLRQTVGGLFDDDLVARSRELLMESIFDPSAGLGMWNVVLAHLCRLTNVRYAPVSSAPWPALPDWSANILMPYLRSVNAAHVQDGATEFATRLWERWHAAQWVPAFDFGFVISSLGLVEEALALVEPSTNVPDRRVAALSAVAVFELRRGRRVEAYDAFRKSVEEGDTARYRVSPRQAYAAQKEFEQLGEPVLAPLHRMVAALVYDGRLTSLEN